MLGNERVDFNKPGKMMSRINKCVISLCDRTGNMVKPWAEEGFDCYCFDLQHPKGKTKLDEGITAIGGSILDFDWVPPKPVSIAFAFPPCTHLANVGSRWWPDKGLKALIHGLTLVEKSRLILSNLTRTWMIENPVGRLSRCWRQPDYTFDPCNYGGYLDPIDDEYTKLTCLWTSNRFVMPVRKHVKPIRGSALNTPWSFDTDGHKSVTPKGFAKAVFEANYLNCI
jgi:hypothetical protein